MFLKIHNIKKTDASQIIIPKIQVEQFFTICMCDLWGKCEVELKMKKKVPSCHQFENSFRTKTTPISRQKP